MTQADARPETTSTRGRAVGVLALAATVVLWSSFALSSRGIGATSLTTIDAALVRFATPLVILSPWLPKALRQLRRERPALLAQILAGGLPHFLLFAEGAHLTSAGLTGLLVPGTVPLFVTALVFAWHRDPIPARRVLALTGIVVGVAVCAVDWYFNGDVPLTEGGSFKVSRASADYVRPLWGEIGAMVIGRHLFDIMNGWDGTPPVGDHVVVVSHRPKPDGWHPEASYHFIDDVTRGVAQAKELAAGRTVTVAAGDLGGQALALGLVDEVAMDVVPVVFGSGKRYFGSIDAVHLLEDPHVVIQGDRVLHLRYRVPR